MGLQVDSAALEGQRAYRSGTSRKANPYGGNAHCPLCSICEMAWTLGWFRACMAFKMAEAQGVKKESGRQCTRFAAHVQKHDELVAQMASSRVQRLAGSTSLPQCQCGGEQPGVRCRAGPGVRF